MIGCSPPPSIPYIINKHQNKRRFEHLKYKSCNESPKKKRKIVDNQCVKEKKRKMIKMMWAKKKQTKFFAKNMELKRKNAKLENGINSMNKQYKHLILKNKSLSTKCNRNIQRINKVIQIINGENNDTKKIKILSLHIQINKNYEMYNYANDIDADTNDISEKMYNLQKILHSSLIHKHSILSQKNQLLIQGNKTLKQKIEYYQSVTMKILNIMRKDKEVIDKDKKCKKPKTVINILHKHSKHSFYPQTRRAAAMREKAREKRKQTYENYEKNHLQVYDTVNKKNKVVDIVLIE